jgi:hypothetical protein
VELLLLLLVVVVVMLLFIIKPVAGCKLTAGMILNFFVSALFPPDSHQNTALCMQHSGKTQSQVCVFVFQSESGSSRSGICE